MKLLKNIQNKRDLVALGLDKRKAEEILHRIKILSEDDSDKFEAIKKAYSEVLRLGYLSKEETFELISHGVNIPKTIFEATEVLEAQVLADIELRKLDSSDVEYVIRYLTPQVEMLKIKK